MRYMVILLTLCNLLYVNIAFSRDPFPKCTVVVNKEKLKTVIAIIEKQTSFRFVYAATAKTNDLPVTLNETQQPLDVIMHKVEAQTGLPFEISGKTIYLKESLKTKPVKGRVSDRKTGETIPGVSVKVVGTGVKTVTNLNGLFELEAPEQDTLLFNYVGYVPLKIAVNKFSGNALLSFDQKLLDEVVVVGYGTQSKKLVSTSVTTLKQEALNKGGFTSPAQLLQGKVAGLTITRSGDPNASPSVSLRGPSTLRAGAAQEPFYVIDGVPGADFRLISPDDIEDISVLKDASATAIYGTRAANGVIMVTTKSGKAGDPLVSYNGYVGTENVSGRINMMNAAQRNDFLAASGKSAKPSDIQGANTDWQKEISRTGMLQNHNLSLSGGVNKTTYSASVNYFQNRGILQKTALERLIGRLSVNQSALNDHLNFSLNLSNSTSTADLLPDQNLILFNALRYMPTVPVRQPDGSYTEDLPRVQYYNPVSLLNNADQQRKTSLTMLNLTTQVKLPWGIKYNLSLSTQKEINNTGTYYTSKYTLKQGFNGEAYRSSYENTRQVAESFFTFDRAFNAHKISLLAGYSWQQDVNGDGFQANNRNFPSDDLGYSNIGLGSPLGNFRTDWGQNQYSKLRLISFYGRANYNYKDRYIAQFSLRRDGSSAFGANNRWGTFPAGSVAWRISQEEFMADQKIFSDLKLRAGYGVTGNSLGFNPLISKIRYGAAGSFYNNGNFVTSIFAVQNANPDLKWEKTAMANVGVDASLFNGRLNVSAEYYEKKTSDLIWEYNVSTTQFFVDKYTANVGKISNKGIELTIDATPVSTGDFKWQTTFNIAHNRNELTSLSNTKFISDSIPMAYGDGQGQTGAAYQLLKTGYPVGQFFTFKYAGKNDKGVSQFYDRNGNLTTSPKEFVDYHYAGNAQPKLLLGFGNTFTYKNFDLNVFLRGAFGAKVMNATLADLNRPGEVESYNLPVFSKGESVNDGNAYRYSDRFIENASYLRVDNATIGYTFNRIPHLKRMRVYVTGNNLAVITNYSGIDPEINLGGLTPGIDNKNYYPRTRSFLLGVNVTF